MSIIKVLDQNTINQIAAGEVVERPASIVKELVENAIDAKSTAVTIEIKGGGIDFIRITDNGSGIDKTQVRTAFLRHATSKISDASDLITVSSLGFRGEALSSIAAVAKVELITKTDEGISGVRYVIEGGDENSFEEIGCPEGTTFIIRNLFYNTPARRKFLKSKITESGYVESFIERLALSHPDISFKFISDNKNKLSTSGNGKLKDVIYNIFGREIALNLLEVDREEAGIAVKGYVGKPIISRGNRNYENYFVNGRFLKNNIITKAVEEGYKGHSMVHKFPFTALMIEMDGHNFDVNVHPAKMEMRFKNGEELYGAVVNAVRGSFVKKELIPRVSVGKDRPAKKPEAKTIPESFERKRMEIEKRFSSLSREKIGEINQKKKETELQNPLENGENDPSKNRSSIEERIARLKINELQDVKKEIDRVIPPLGDQISGRPADKSIDRATDRPIDRSIDRTTGNAADQSTGDKSDQSTGSTSDETTDKSINTILDSQEKTVAKAVKEPDTYGKQIDFTDIPLLSREARPKHRIIGQVFRTYWMVEYEEQLFFVDQHAAHEKVMYEKLKKDLEKNEIVSQLVAPPIILTFSIKERERFLMCQEAFEKMGYQVEEFGGNEYCIRAVPANLLEINQQDLFIEILDQIDEGSGKLNLDLITDKLASMACKAAVKGNQRLSIAEMDHLMDQLLELDNPYQCPHGRPTIISMSRYEIEKKFKRVQ